MSVIFSDDFNRTDSGTVGNGWSENTDTNNNLQIASNQLRFRWVSQGWGGTDHGCFRDIGQHKNLRIEFDWTPSAGATVDGNLPQVGVLSNGSGDNGYYMNLYYLPQTDDFWFYIFDGATQRASFKKYDTVSTGTVHKVEILIDDNYWMEGRIWRPSLGESRPATADISFTNSGTPYVPSASGSNFMINGYHGSTAGHSVTVDVDNLMVSSTLSGLNAMFMGANF